jgi:hypothetical protein
VVKVEQSRGVVEGIRVPPRREGLTIVHCIAWN